jgi:hypothetical protein
MGVTISVSMSVDTGGEKPKTLTLLCNWMTHNVSDMWRLAGCYDEIYNADSLLAGNIADKLEDAVEEMIEHPDAFKLLNPPNGWGDYNTALDFLKDFAKVCKENPRATVDTVMK